MVNSSTPILVNTSVPFDIKGKGGTSDTTLFIQSLMFFVQSVRVDLEETRHEISIAMQVAHDPRIGGTKSFSEAGSGARVALHRRRKRSAAVGKRLEGQPHVFLPPRMVQTPPLPYSQPPSGLKLPPAAKEYLNAMGSGLTVSGARAKARARRTA